MRILVDLIFWLVVGVVLFIGLAAIEVATKPRS